MEENEKNNSDNELDKSSDSIQQQEEQPSEPTMITQVESIENNDNERLKIDTNKSEHLILYYFELNVDSRSVTMLIDLLKLKPQLHPVDMRKGEHRTEEFQKLSPAGRLPILIDKNLVLYDSSAIQIYLIEKYANSIEKKKLLGEEEESTAKINMVLYYNSSRLYKPLADWLRPQVFHKAKPNEEENKKMKQSLDQLQVLLKTSSTSFLVNRKEPSIADISTFASISFLKIVDFNLSSWSAIKTWMSRFQSKIGKEIVEKNLLPLMQYKKELKEKIEKLN